MEARAKPSQRERRGFRKNPRVKAKRLSNNGLSGAHGMLGFTIVELLITVAIIAVLAGLILPVLSRTRQRARMTQCAGNLQQIGQAYAVCLVENNGYLPEAFYNIDSTAEGYKVSFQSIESNTGTSLFRNGQTNFLNCPSDADADHVVLDETPARQFLVDASYGYNLRLPVGFRNISRVPKPSNTVTFYDGDPGLLVGTWDPESTLAQDSVRPRHVKSANFLFLDGHVENVRGFPDNSFEGGVSWAVALGNNTSEDDGWSGSSGAGGAAENEEDGDDGNDSSGGEEYSSDDVGDSSGDGDDSSGNEETDPEPEGIIGGAIGINANNNSAKFSFQIILPDGLTVTRDNLHADNPLSHSGFHPDYLEYSGPAVSVRLKPNGNENSITLDGEPYELESNKGYRIASDDMEVRLYNSKRNKNGKAMGNWWIEINATGAEIEVLN